MDAPGASTSRKGALLEPEVEEDSQTTSDFDRCDAGGDVGDSAVNCWP